MDSPRSILPLSPKKNLFSSSPSLCVWCSIEMGTKSFYFFVRERVNRDTNLLSKKKMVKRRREGEFPGQVLVKRRRRHQSEFPGHVTIEGRPYPCVTLFIVPRRTKEGDFLQVPAWVPNTFIRKHAVNQWTHDRERLMALFEDPDEYDPEDPSPHSDRGLLYSFLKWTDAAKPDSVPNFLPGSSGVQTRTISLCVPSLFLEPNFWIKKPLYN